MTNRRLLVLIGVALFAFLVWIGWSLTVKSRVTDGRQGSGGSKTSGAGPGWSATGADGSGFSIVPSGKARTLYDVYESTLQAGGGQFITVDLALHTTWRLYAFALRSMELKVCYPQTATLIPALSKAAEKLYASAPPGDIKKASRGLLAYLSVGAILLEPGLSPPGEVKDDVLADLDLIEKHEGPALSRTLPYVEDFSQYVPRGHYTISKQFERYFKAMMWFGRRLFRVEERNPGGAGPGETWNEEAMLRETREILLLAYLLDNTEVGGAKASSRWKAIVEGVDPFAGPTEDLDLYAVEKLSGDVWGKIPAPADLEDREKVLRFVSLAREATHPKIDSSGTGRKGFSLFGQRFLPDSYILQSLVSSHGSLKYTGDNGKRPFSCGTAAGFGLVRTFPRGLDILAALGSGAASRMLDETGDSAYGGYPEKLASLQKEIPGLVRSGAGKSAFYGFFDSLPLLLAEPKGKTLPGFFLTRAWAVKQSSSALGGWVEFRHDLVLYAKQSYTAVGSALVGTGQNGYVEPYPAFYRRTARLVSQVGTIVGSQPELSGFESNFQTCGATLERLAAIAEKELRGEELDSQDLQDISQCALQMKSATMFPGGAEKGLGLDADNNMAVVTDVHTDLNSQMVLEEGTGTPFVIEVHMQEGGKAGVLKGGVFSYFEFKQPMSDRLGDPAWQAIAAKERGLSFLPDWYTRFLK
jgi:hypothetical protein